MRNLEPNTQIDFYLRLEAIRNTVLAEALAAAVKNIALTALDKDLSTHVPPDPLKLLASFGLRGETFFATPTLLQAKPALIGYYRMLYGFSQKSFYSQGPFGRFKKLEDTDDLTERLAQLLPELCDSLAASGTRLLLALPRISIELIHELQLLTLGPQLRGSRNTSIGKAAGVRVMHILHRISGEYVTGGTQAAFIIRNSAGRHISVISGADPDVRVEDGSSTPPSPIIAMEIKGGGDVSNVHNRIGEAEKSHLKARARGFNHRWTILAAKVDLDTARAESPSTTEFFDLDLLEDQKSPQEAYFRQEISRHLGIPSA